MDLKPQLKELLLNKLFSSLKFIKMKKSIQKLVLVFAISIITLLTIAVFFADKIQIGVLHH